jgi:hypothetical protein
MKKMRKMKIMSTATLEPRGANCTSQWDLFLQKKNYLHSQPALHSVYDVSMYI